MSLDSLFPGLVASIWYLIFVIYYTLSNRSRSTQPNIELARWHFKFSIFLAGIAFILDVFVLNILNLTFADWLFGIVFFYLIHYGGFCNIYGLASRSISSTMLADMMLQGGSLSISELSHGYANGKGIEFVRNNRIQWMLKLRFIEESFNTDFNKSPAQTQSNIGYKLTRRGKNVAVLTDKLLNLWGLTQLGKDTP